MSILDPIEQKPKVEDVMNAIAVENLTLFNTVANSIKANYDRFWSNPNFTPAQISEAYGTDALSLFEISYSFQQLLKAVNPDYEMMLSPENYTITPNADGTVEIVEIPVEPTPEEVTSDTQTNEEIPA